VSKRKKGSSATMVVLIASTWLSTTKREKNFLQSLMLPRKKIKKKL
jgi:hypothetical protein